MHLGSTSAISVGINTSGKKVKSPRISGSLAGSIGRDAATRGPTLELLDCGTFVRSMFEGSVAAGSEGILLSDPRYPNFWRSNELFSQIYCVNICL